MLRAAALLLVLLAGCGSSEGFTPPASPAAPSLSRELGLHPGESMAFEVKLGGLAVGEAALAVGEVGDFEGHSAITVVSKIGTTGAARLLRAIDDESTTVIDAASGKPLRLTTHVLMGGRETFSTAVFSPGRVRIDSRRAKDAPPRI